MVELFKQAMRRLMLDSEKNIPNILVSKIYSGIGSILLFHRVVKPEDARNTSIGRSLEVSVDYLEYIINYFLSNRYDIISLDELHMIMEENTRPKKKFVVFTFDDGYLDNYTLAYPIFKRYNAPFTIYVTTSFPDRDAEIWWYAISDLVEKSESIFYRYDGRDCYFEAKSKQEKDDTISELIRRVSNSGSRKRELIESIFKDTEVNMRSYVEDMTMTWDQVHELSRDELVTIGAHTVSHPNLRAIGSERAKDEIVNSKKKLELVTGKKVDHFAFPYGHKGAASVKEFELVRRLGFKTAVTTREGNLFVEHKKHLHCLPRIGLDPFSYPDFKFPHYHVSGLIPMLKNKYKRIISD
jgi:peptidoglycan/xylan/chitin deacetylase (PgdA/CDA1 family)